MSAFRPRVLVIAEACNPEWVSVPLIGWSMVNALRKVADVHLVTQIRNKDALVRAGLVPGVDFTPIDSEGVARGIWKLTQFLRMGENKGWTTVQALSVFSYAYFEQLLWRQFGSDIKAGAYDLVHRVTPLSPTTPSPVARRLLKAGQPFVVGPLNGGVPWPKGFDTERRREREWLSYVRSVYKLVPGHAQTMMADALIVGSKHTASDIEAQHRDRIVRLPENGIDPSRFWQVARHDQPVLRLCFVGRMVPYKGPDMLLDAATPLLQTGKAVLDFVGDGPLLDGLKRDVAERGLERAVTFHGWLRHDKVQEVLGKADLFSFPSIREFGGGAVLEAMALGVAPLVVDYAGPGELVDDETGFKVPLGSRAEVIDRVRQKLEELSTQPERVAIAGTRARQKVLSHFTWDKKAEQMLEIYRFALGQRGKPDFFGAEAR